MDEIVEKTIKSLEKNGFNVFYAQKSEIARKKILDIIPKSSSVGIGGDSATLRQIGVLEEFSKEGRPVINPFSVEICRLLNSGECDKKQHSRLIKLSLLCDYFLTGTNALTQDGKLVNTDSAGNRVAGMIYGPEKVVLVIGTNKIVKDVDEASYRLKNIIAPNHSKMKERRTPCATTGKCSECNSKERICNVTTIIEKSPAQREINVVLIDEDLGLGWDESWSKERIEKIHSNYAEATIIRRPSWLNDSVRRSTTSSREI